MASDEGEENRELSDEEPGDVEIFTGVRAQELKFGIVPETKVWFEGDPRTAPSPARSASNLPEEVEPGKTYRDIKVRWTARSRIVHPTDSPDFDESESE